jgi:O-antigen/teichoic acid export membrane protein
MNQRRVLRNTVTSIIQVIVMGVTMFFLYRFIFAELGAEQFGVWSLVLASTSLAQVASLGLSGSAVKFVAKYLAREDERSAARLLETTLIFTCCAMTLVLLLVYPFLAATIPLVMNGKSAIQALSILPFAVISIWLIALLSVYYGGLEGCQRIDVRSALMVFGSFLYAGLCLLFLKGFEDGLLGLAYANVLQYLILVIASLIALRRYVRVSIIPYHWDNTLFREIIGYGLNFQVANIFAALVDPVTKLLLSIFGGIASVGYYALAYNVVTQFRSIIVTANRVLVPAFANLAERAPEAETQMYVNSLNVAFFVSVPIYTGIVVAGPVFSFFLVGSVVSEFVISIWCIAIGSFFSTLAAPAYMAYLGNGKLRWNTASEALSVILLIGVSWILGASIGGAGVLVGWATARSVASLIVPMTYHRQHDLRKNIVLTKSNIELMIAAFLSIVTNYLLINRMGGNVSFIGQLIISTICFGVIVFVPLWKHPMRYRLQTWVWRTVNADRPAL